MNRVAPQMIVESNGRRGVTVPDFMGCCAEFETPVVWEGESTFSGTETHSLTVVGPENAGPDPAKCGAGRGADCCIFLTVGAGGFSCERFSSLRYTLLFRVDKMNAKREPVPMFPSCQLVEGEVVK